MSRILITSDLHLTDHSHEDYRHRLIASLPSLIKSERADALLILGDLTEEKDRHRAQLVNRIVDHLCACASLVPVINLMGNHDYANEGHPFFEFIGRLKGVHWIGRVTDGFTLPGILSDYFRHCIFLPHTRQHERDWQDIKWKPFEVAFAHNTFTGATTPTGKILEGIKLRSIPSSIKVIAGDVHTPQSWDNLTYIGAPYSVDFGDNYRSRMCVLDTDSLKLTDVDTSREPQKMDVVSTLDNPNGFWEDLKALRAGDVVRCQVEVEDMAKWHSTREQVSHALKQLGCLPYRILPVLKGRTMQRRSAVRQIGTGPESEREVIQQYAKRHEMSEPFLTEAIDIITNGTDLKAGLKK